MHSKSLLFKLTAGYMAIIVVSLLCAGILFLAYLRSDIYEAKTAAVMDETRKSAVLAGRLMETGSLEPGWEWSSLGSGLPGSAAVLTDESGAILLDTRPEPLKQISPGSSQAGLDFYVDSALQGGQTTAEIENDELAAPFLVAAVPIPGRDGTTIGALVVYTTLDEPALMLNRAAFMLLAAIFLAMAMTGLFSYLYAGRFTRPLQMMQQSALEMARGNYEIDIKWDSEDEVGRLADALDLLASRLAYTIDQLYQEQGKLEDLIASISEGILAFDRELNLIGYNQAALDMLSCPSGSSPAWANIGPCLDEQHLMEDFQEVIKAGEKQTRTVQLGQNTLRWIISPVYNKKRSSIGAVALVHDISESERLERMRRDFVANVSHELRTPLTAIRGYAEAMLDGTASDESLRSRYNERILQETRGMERLVGDLLDLARLQSGKMPLNYEEFNLPDLIQDLVMATSQLARAREITVNIDSRETALAINSDYDRLRQLLLIFIDNAIRHSPAGAQVAISCTGGEELTVTVRDNGCGIAAEDLPYIWERFYKADRARSGGGGTGLGLAIARSLAGILGANVHLESAIGLGTTVYIRLPREG